MTDSGDDDDHAQQSINWMQQTSKERTNVDT
jgi:hypothetical protein